MSDGSIAHSSDGAPSDCVALGILGFFNQKFDLVVSGINPQPNLGHDVTYSGTVTAYVAMPVINKWVWEADKATLDQAALDQAPISARTTNSIPAGMGG